MKGNILLDNRKRKVFEFLFHLLYIILVTCLLVIKYSIKSNKLGFTIPFAVLQLGVLLMSHFVMCTCVYPEVKTGLWTEKSQKPSQHSM